MEFSNSSGHTSVCQTGFFLNPSGHTMVCQTGFLNTFCTRMSKAILRSHKPIFLNATGHTMVCQIERGRFDILDLDVNDHSTVSQNGSVVWSLTSYVEKVTGKKGKKTGL